MSNLFIAVDFDGTVVLHKYPYIGSDVPHAARVLKRIQEAGHKIILNTMRSDGGDDGPVLSEAVEWFTSNEIRLYGINQNPTQKTWTSSPKVYAHLYIDDAALGCPLTETGWQEDRPYVDWMAVEKILEARGVLPRL